MADEVNGAQAQDSIIVSTSEQQQSVTINNDTKSEKKNIVPNPKKKHIDSKVCYAKYSSDLSSTPHIFKQAGKDGWMDSAWGEREVYRGLPPSISKEVNKHLTLSKKGNVFLLIKADVNKSSWNFIKEMSEFYSKKNKRLVFIGVYNCASRLKVMRSEFKNSVEIMPLFKLKNSPNFKTQKEGGVYGYFDTSCDPNIAIESRISVNVYRYICLINGTEYTCFSRQKLEEGEEYFFYGIYFPLYTNMSCGRYSIPVCDYAFLLGETNSIKHDYKKLNDVLQYIKEPQQLSMAYNFLDNQPFYTDDEVLIITIGTFFVMDSVHGLNLIICGRPSTKKSTWCSMLKMLFEGSSIGGTGSTLKGLIPSHYGDKPSSGSLVSVSYICVLDEMFKLFALQGDSKLGVKGNIKKGMMSLMEVLEHRKITFTGGKGEITIHMKNSFLATDNFTNKQEIHDLYWDDREDNMSLFKRFSFLYLCEESQKRSALKKLSKKDEELFQSLMARFSKVMHIEEIKEPDKPKEYVETLFQFMRDRVKNVKADEHRIESIAERVWKIKNDAGGIATALISGIVILNQVFSCTKIEDMSFVAKEKDYQDFERLLKRMHDDYCRIVNTDPENPSKGNPFPQKGEVARQENPSVIYEDMSKEK